VSKKKKIRITWTPYKVPKVDNKQRWKGCINTTGPGNGIWVATITQTTENEFRLFLNFNGFDGLSYVSGGNHRTLERARETAANKLPLIIHTLTGEMYEFWNWSAYDKL